MDPDTNCTGKPPFTASACRRDVFQTCRHIDCRHSHMKTCRHVWERFSRHEKGFVGFRQRCHLLKHLKKRILNHKKSTSPNMNQYTFKEICPTEYFRFLISSLALNPLWLCIEIVQRTRRKQTKNLDKVPCLSIRIVIFILPSDIIYLVLTCIVFVCSKEMFFCSRKKSWKEF